MGKQERPRIYLPLTDAEILHIRMGGYLTTHFNHKMFSGNRLTVIAGFKESLPDLDSPLAHHYTSIGDFVTFQVSDDLMNNMMAEEGFIASALAQVADAEICALAAKSYRMISDRLQLKRQTD